MNQWLDGFLGIVVFALLAVIAISWVLFPIWIYTINQNVKLIVESLNSNKT